MFERLIAAVAFMAVSLSLMGCATRYQEMGFAGGVTAQQLTADTWRIVARGNGYTGSTRVQDFVLLKAAETTRAAGGKYFVISASQDASRRDTVVTPPSAETTFVGNSAYTTFKPESVNTEIHPGQDTYIQVLRLPPGAQPPPGTLNADEIVQYIGPRLKG
jgi:hypothetical protein